MMISNKGRMGHSSRNFRLKKMGSKRLYSLLERLTRNLPYSTTFRAIVYSFIKV